MHRFFFKKIIVTSPETPPVARGGLCRLYYFTGDSSGREGRLMPTTLLHRSLLRSRGAAYADHITTPESPPVARGGLCRLYYFTGASSGREGRLMPTSNCRCWHRVKSTDIDASLYISAFNSMTPSLTVGASLIFTRKKTSKLLLFKNLEASIKERETGFEPYYITETRIERRFPTRLFLLYSWLYSKMLVVLICFQTLQWLKPFIWMSCVCF